MPTRANSTNHRQKLFSKEFRSTGRGIHMRLFLNGRKDNHLSHRRNCELSAVKRPQLAERMPTVLLSRAISYGGCTSVPRSAASIYLLHLETGGCLRRGEVGSPSVFISSQVRCIARVRQSYIHPSINCRATC